jgi:hypothetical protein
MFLVPFSPSLSRSIRLASAVLFEVKQIGWGFRQLHLEHHADAGCSGLLLSMRSNRGVSGFSLPTTP